MGMLSARERKKQGETVPTGLWLGEEGLHCGSRVGVSSSGIAAASSLEAAATAALNLQVGRMGALC
jgi:hypothetical protein